MWAKLDDALLGHPKVLSAGLALGRDGSIVALGFYVSCLLHANRYLTDGFLSDAVIAHLHSARPAEIAGELVKARLLDRVDGGYQIHDFHDHNLRADSVRKKRKADRDRKRKKDEES